MKTLLPAPKRIFIFCILILIVVVALGQNIVSLSPFVGEKIDKDEFKKFKIGEFYNVNMNEFEYGELLALKKDSYTLIFYMKHDEKIEVSLNNSSLRSLRNMIDEASGPLGTTLTEVRMQLEAGASLYLRLNLEEGIRIIGIPLRFENESIVLITDIGEVSILIELIEKAELEGLDFHASSQYGFTNPNATRYLFAPSAIPLKKGEGYYQNVWVLVNSANVGITDHISLTGGIELISTLSTIFADGPGSLLFTNIKASGKVANNLYLGGGVLAGAMVGPEFENFKAGIGYGLATIGNPEHNVTLALGYGGFNGEWANRPIVVISGMTRLNKRLGLVSENWIVSSYNEYSWEYNYGYEYYSVTNDNLTMAFSGAMRIMTEKITFDIGLVSAGNRNKYVNTYSDRPVESGVYTDWIPIPIPYLDFVYKF